MTRKEKDAALAPFGVELDQIVAILQRVPMGLQEELTQDALDKTFYVYAEENGISGDLEEELPAA